MPFTSGAYTTSICSRTDNAALPSSYAVSVSGLAVTSGMNIGITITNATGTNLAGIKVRFDAGWGTSGVTAAPTGMFLADISFKNRAVGSQYVNSLRNDFWGTSAFSTGVDAGAGINIPCVVLHAGDRAIGISTNYPYAHEFGADMLSGTTYGWYIRGDMSYTSDAGNEQINDFYSSGETRTWNVWLRESSGTAITTGLALSLIQPYTDWFTGNWPNQRPPAISGRIHGQFFGQTESSGNPRGYNIISGIYPSSGSVDWNTVLGTFFPTPAALRARGENGVMIWCLPGKVPTYEFPMNVIESMPDNLKTTLYQVNDWSRTNDISVYLYIGAGYLYFQPSGNWDDPFFRMESQFNSVIGSGYSLATTTRHAINPTGQRISQYNIDNGAMVWFDGVGLDAMPDVVLRPYMTGVLQSLRDQRPGKLIVGEAYKTPQTQSYIPCTYYPPTKWDGLRCPWMDTVFPGYQNFALVNSSEFANTGTFVAEVDRCQAGGLCVITLTSPTSFGAIAPVTYPKIQIKDSKSKTGRSRGVR